MFEKGEKVGQYEIVEKLGQGGMATVYKAYHPNLERFVALKVLHPALKQTEGFIERFEREAKLIAKLDHPNIVAVYDYAEYKSNPYLVMRFIEGETLKTSLARGAFNRALINQVVVGVGEGLAYAHKQGILHRDIKPSNVMLSKDLKVFITDFGLARMAQVGESTLSRDMLIGTPQYLSPEQARGEKLDIGSDIYSFGVVIYELMVGKVPFNADTPYAIIHDHIFTPLPMPRDLNPQVSDSIEGFLLKALAKKREDRYRTVDEMVKAFTMAVESARVGQAGKGADGATPVDVRRPSGRKTQPRPAATKPTTPRPPARPETGKARKVAPPPRQKPRRSGLWPVIGLLLLIVLLVVAGVLFGEVITEELNFVFGGADGGGVIGPVREIAALVSRII